MIVPHESVWHNGIAKNHFFQIDPLQIGIGQVSSSQISFKQVSPSEIGISEIGTPESGITQISSSEVSSSQISTIQIGISQTGITQIGSSQIGKFEETNSGTAQVSPTEVNPSQILASQVHTSKIPLPSSISSEQFLSVHNSTPKSIYTPNNTALSLWNTLLSPSTPLDINLLFTDLPTGQLAEAQITQDDPSGHPNGGVVLQKLFKDSPTPALHSNKRRGCNLRLDFLVAAQNGKFKRWEHLN